MSVQLLAVNVVTFDVMEELPYVDCGFSSEINGPGQWSASLPLSTSTDGFEKLSDSALAVNETCVVFVRDGVPLFMGFMTQEDDEITDDEDSIKIGGPSAAVGYLEHRMLTATKTYSQVDQFVIAQDLIDNYSNPIGLNIETRYDALSGVLRDRTYHAPDRHILGTLIDNLAQLDNGFDYMADVEGSQATGFTPIVRLGYPNLMRRTSFVLDLEKNITRFTRVRDGGQQANRAAVQGAVQGEFAMVATVQDSSLWSRYPIMDAVFSKSTVLEFETLVEHGRKYVRTRRHPVTELQLDVDTTNHDSTPGSFRVGDEFRVIARKGRIDIDSIYRVKSWSLSVDVDGAESMSMAMVPTGDLT